MTLGKSFCLLEPQVPLGCIGEIINSCLHTCSLPGKFEALSLVGRISDACAQGPTLTALSTESGHYSTDLDWRLLGASVGAGRGVRPARPCPRHPPTHLISGLLSPAGRPCFPARLSNCSSFCPWGFSALFLILFSTTLFENNLCQCPQPRPWRERRRRQPKCQGSGHVAGLCLGCPAAEAPSPGAGHVARLLAAQGRPRGRRGLGRPGLAAAPWDGLAHSGGRETQAWEESGIRLVLPMAARWG